MFLNRQFLTIFFATIALVNAAMAETDPTVSDLTELASPASSVSATGTTPVTGTFERVPAPIEILDRSQIVTLPDPTAAATPEIDIWQRIRNGFAMRELNSKLIARHEKWYASHPDYVTHMSERSQRYLYYITQEVERRGMPSEIALLPIIESAFNPSAYSSGRASGIWQFISSTGKNFGMQQNWWYDGRRDVISATKGALDYLQQLHEQFGDWELALAAYNWGEGAVSRAQARNRKLHKPTDFSNLRLPRETQNYVPKLLAVKHIVNDPEHFGLKLTGIPNRPYFAAVTTSQPIDVKLAAELADISMEEFLALNPGHNRPVILQENATLLLLPVDKLDTFQTNLKNNNQRLVSWQPYQSKKGEHFDEVAPKFGLSAEKLRSINGLSARAKISSGQTLLVPVNSEQPGETGFASFNTNLVSIDDSIGKTFTHIVHKGENASIIARHYHISLAQLHELNKGMNKLKVGQHLTVVQSIARGHNSRLAKAHQNRNTKLVRGNRPQKQNTSRANIKIASSR